MKVRKFFLENEKGQQIDMNNFKESCFLTSPTGLGYSNQSDFKQLGNTFIENNRNIEQSKLAGTVHFKNYDKCKEFIDFIEKSENLRWIYIIPFLDRDKKFYRDVSIQQFSKTEKKTNILSCPIIFNGLGLWYEEDKIIYKIEPQENEIRWNFMWDSRFVDYNTRYHQYINRGHIEAPIYLEINGYVERPKIELYVEGQLYQVIPFNTIIQKYEKLLYDSRENRFLIEKQNTDGTRIDLYDLDIIDIYNDNVLRIPKGRSCEIKITADNDIQYALLLIFPQYKFV